MTNPSPTTLQYLLYAMLFAFAVGLTFIPAFARSIADVLLRHAAAMQAAYDSYQKTWNGWGPNA